MGDQRNGLSQPQRMFVFGCTQPQMKLSRRRSKAKRRCQPSVSQFQISEMSHEIYVNHRSGSSCDSPPPAAIAVHSQPNTQSGRWRGRPSTPCTGGMASTSARACCESLQLAPVSWIATRINRTLDPQTIHKYNQKQRAGVVQWQNGSFPSFGRGFDSHRPLHNSR